jgi:hypothetical protein
MRKILIVMLLPLLAFALTTTNGQRYSVFTSIPNPDKFTKVFYYDDMTKAYLYDSSNMNAKIFTGYSWQPIVDSVLSNFTTEPNHITYFRSDKNEDNFLYGDHDGHVMKKFPGAIVQLWSIDDDDEKNVLKVVQSPDQTIVAAFS